MITNTPHDRHSVDVIPLTTCCLGVIEGDKSEEPPEDKLYTHLFELCVKIEDGAEPEGEMIESSTTNFSHKTVHDALQYLSEAEMDIFNSLTTTVKA